MSVLGENFGDSLLSALWYFLPGTVITIPILLNYSKVIPQEIAPILTLAFIPLIFLFGFCIHTIYRLLTYSYYFGGDVYFNGAKYFHDYFRKTFNVVWDDEFIECVYNYYFYSNKDRKYEPLINDIKRKNFFNAVNGTAAMSFLAGGIIFAILSNFDKIPNFNSYGGMAYIAFAAILLYIELNLKKHVDIEKIFLLERHRKDVEKDKDLEKIYGKLKEYSLRKRMSLKDALNHLKGDFIWQKKK